MKRYLKIVAFAPIVLLGVLLVPSPKARPGPDPTTSDGFLRKVGLTPVGALPPNDPETLQLESLFSSEAAAANSVPPGLDAGATRRALDNELRAELETFVTNNPASAWTPSLHMFLGQRAQLRCGYSLALDHYQLAFESVAGSSDPLARAIARQASGGLANLLALTGRLGDLDALEAAVIQLGLGRSGSGWAQEMREWARKTPSRDVQVWPLLPGPTRPADATRPIPPQEHN